MRFHTLVANSEKCIIQLKHIQAITLDKTNIKIAFANTQATGFCFGGFGLLLTSKYSHTFNFHCSEIAKKEFEVIQKKLEQEQEQGQQPKV